MRPSGLTETELKVLNVFKEYPITSNSVLLEQTQLKRSVIARIMDRLIVFGLIDEKKIRREDGRGLRNEYRLTPNGKLTLATPQADIAVDAPEKPVVARSPVDPEIRTAEEPKPDLAVLLRSMAAAFLKVAEQLESE